jgi:hypothetical protein
MVLTKKMLVIAVMLLPMLSIAQWKQTKFIIGTYVDVSPDSTDKDLSIYKKHVKEAKAAYFNFFSGKNNYNKFLPYTNDAMHIKMLEVLRENNIQSFYLTPRGKPYTDSLAGKVFSFMDALPPQLKDVIFGYSVRDEPKLPEAPNIRKWLTVLKSKDPQKVAYINMFPSYAFKSHELYEAYLDTFLCPKQTIAKPAIVSFDFYPFVNGSLRKDYFYNLYILKQKAEGRPIWYYPYTPQHRNYNNPAMYELSFMAFCPIAYGGKGCIYFTYDTPVDTPEPYHYAIRDTAGNLTEKYNYVKAINHYLNDIIGPVVMRSKLCGPYHVSENPYNQWIDKSETAIENIPVLKSIANYNMLAACFSDTSKANTKYLYIVNKSSDKQNTAVVLNGNYTGKLMLSVPVLSYAEHHSQYDKVKTVFNKKDNSTALTIDFEPGEARMVMIKDK